MTLEPGITNGWNLQMMGLEEDFVFQLGVFLVFMLDFGDLVITSESVLYLASPVDQTKVAGHLGSFKGSRILPRGKVWSIWVP